VEGKICKGNKLIKKPTMDFFLAKRVQKRDAELVCGSLDKAFWRCLSPLSQKEEEVS
jgi:hypothetical protein